MNAQRAEAGPAAASGPRHSAYTEVPNTIIDDPTLDAYEVRLYAVIRRRDWRGAGWVFTFSELQAAVRCGKDKLQGALRTLDERGMIRREGPAKRPKRYFALVPEAPSELRPDRNRITARAPSAAPPITAAPQSDYCEPSIGLLPNRTASIYQRPSQTITTNSGSESREISEPHAQPPPPPPSHPAIEQIVSTWLGCNGQSAEKAHAATLARYRQWAAEALGRGYSADELVGCLVYTAGRRDAAGKSYTITDVILADRLEPWIAAGRPERYEAPPPRETAGPRRADLPAPLIPCEPYHAVICRCGRIQGRPHRRNICRMSGLVAKDNYRDMHNPDWITTPEGEFEEYDESEQEQSAAASG